LDAINGARCTQRDEATATDLSCQCDTGYENFLSQIVMEVKTWVHCFESKSMQKSIKWPHMATPRKNKFKSAHSAGKIMVTVFWDE
jgi:hypothetical protein